MLLKVKHQSEPLISVGMPVMNGERFLPQALDSILSQDYQNLEVIISDNASTDKTQAICRTYAAKDKRIRFYAHTVDRKASWNVNHVYDLASGEYFMWAAHDDFWDHRYLRACLSVLLASKKTVLAGTQCKSVDSESCEVFFTDKGFSTAGLNARDRFMRYRSTMSDPRNIGAIFHGLYRRDALNKVMPLRPLLATDHLLLAQLSLHGELVTIPETLMVKRQGGGSQSHEANARVIGTNHPFLISFPYLVRELLLQSIIFRTRELTRIDKVRLSLWSIRRYLTDNVWRALYRRFKKRRKDMTQFIKRLRAAI